MKKNIIYILCSLTVLLSGCFKEYEDRYIFEDNRIEFEDAVTTSNTSGKTFPILGPIPAEEGKVVFRVNMTGRQAGHNRTVKFRIVPEETTAIEGIDFSLPQGREFTIPANSSFGYIEVNLLPDGGGSPTVVLELLPTEDIKVLDRYHRIGLRFLYQLTKPDPALVQEINDIKYHTDYVIGTQSNQNIGYFVDASNLNIYTRPGADVNSEKIDFGLMNGSTSGLNLMIPNSTRWTAFSAALNVVTTFPHLNSGTILRISNPESADMAIFNNATTAADLLSAYSYFSATIASRSGYNATNDGPRDHIRHVAPGDLIMYYSLERQVVVMLHVKETIPTNTGEIRTSIKTGKFDPNIVLEPQNLTIETLSTTGSIGLVDLATKTTYGFPGANTNEKRINTDFGYVWSSTGYGNFIAMSASYSGWGTINNIITGTPPIGWTSSERNSGTFIHFENPTSEQVLAVSRIVNRDELVAAYEQAEIDILSVPNYDSQFNGPATRVRRMVPGSILFFKSNASGRDLYSVIIVQSLSTASSTNRRMELLIKSDLR